MITMDAKMYNKDKHIMYTQFKGALNGIDRIIIFKHITKLGMPLSFVTTSEQFYVISTTNYITPHGTTPQIDSNRGTLHQDTLSLFLGGPGGGALAGPSASRHLAVVGVGNPVAVPCVTR
jgi:hypothetical protein